MKQSICVVSILVIAGILLLVGYMWIRPKESYANIGDVDNVGSLDDLHDAHEMIERPKDAEYYAKLVSGDEMQNYESLPGIRPMERLERIQGSDLLPRVSRNVTPYNVDIADPKTHSYMVNPPRVQLKDPIAMLADVFRGDIPITYHPDISLINRTRYGRDSLRLDGFFSDAYVDLYNKYTGKGFKNMPMAVANEETLMDYV